MRLLPIALGIFLSCITDSADARSEKSDRRIPSWAVSHLMQGDVATNALYLFATCVAAESREATVDFLKSRPGSPEERAAAQALTAGENHPCLYRTKRLTIRNRDLLRGAFAEALYNGSKVRPRTGEPLPFPEDFEKNSAFGAAVFRTEESKITRWVGTCAVRGKPLLAHNVLRYLPNSPAETRALRALNSTFVACLPPAKALTGSRLAVRAALAEALYAASQDFKEAFKNG